MFAPISLRARRDPKYVSACFWELKQVTVVTRSVGELPVLGSAIWILKFFHWRNLRRLTDTVLQ